MVDTPGASDVLPHFRLCRRIYGGQKSKKSSEEVSEEDRQEGSQENCQEGGQEESSSEKGSPKEEGSQKDCEEESSQKGRSKEESCEEEKEVVIHSHRVSLPGCELRKKRKKWLASAGHFFLALITS